MNYTYTKEQDEWLRENWMRYGGESVQMFNERFGQNRTYQMIRAHCQNVLKVRVSKAVMSRRGRRNAKRHVPIGSVTKAKGYWQIKVADEYGKRPSNWMLLHRYNYIKAFGEIPDGMVVIFLDGNKDNCDASNLKAVPQAINALLMKKDLRSIHKALTEAGIEWCELYQLLQKNGYFDRERERELERKKIKRYTNLNADQKIAVDMCDMNGNVIRAFDGVAEASRAMNVNASHISACARGKRHTCGGYKWKYAERTE